jgi:hypothetical protein
MPLTKEDLQLVLNGFLHIPSDEGERAAFARVEAEVEANPDGTVWLPSGPLPHLPESLSTKPGVTRQPE